MSEEQHMEVAFSHWKCMQGEHSCVRSTARLSKLDLPQVDHGVE